MEKKRWVVLRSNKTPSEIGIIVREIFLMLEKQFTVMYASEVRNDPSLRDTVNAAVLGSSCQIPELQEHPEDFKRLKVILSLSNGIEYLNVDLMKQHGIRVATSASFMESTAELVGSLLMASARQLPGLIQNAKYPIPVSQQQLRTIDDCPLGVVGMTIGIVGLGRIGFRFAQFIRGFDMRVLYHNRTRRSLADEKEVNATYIADLHDMLPECDYVVITCPLTEETTALIGRPEFKMMKKSAVIINVARGKIIDQDAMVTALKSGEIAGAALDTTDPFRLPPEHPLLHMPNVICTGHKAYETKRALLFTMKNAVEALKLGLDGKEMPNEIK